MYERLAIRSTCLANEGEVREVALRREIINVRIERFRAILLGCAFLTSAYTRKVRVDVRFESVSRAAHTAEEMDDNKSIFSRFRHENDLICGDDKNYG